MRETSGAPAGLLKTQPATSRFGAPTEHLNAHAAARLFAINDLQALARPVRSPDVPFTVAGTPLSQSSWPGEIPEIHGPQWHLLGLEVGSAVGPDHGGFAEIVADHLSTRQDADVLKHGRPVERAQR